MHFFAAVAAAFFVCRSWTAVSHSIHVLFYHVPYKSYYIRRRFKAITRTLSTLCAPMCTTGKRLPLRVLRNSLQIKIILTNGHPYHSPHYIPEAVVFLVLEFASNYLSCKPFFSNNRRQTFWCPKEIRPEFSYIIL